jgi:hypothetical protein
MNVSTKKSILYYSERGEANTEQTLREAKTRAEELDITNIVVASTRGNTAVQAVEAFLGYNVVIVPHLTGLQEAGVQERAHSE